VDNFQEAHAASRRFGIDFTHKFGGRGEKMRDTGHPFILGSECDVLSVPGSEREILAKVEAFMKLT
jgi:hypothetical protein